MKLEELTVTGMTCASCSARVEKVVGRLEGVESASVNLATEKLRVRFDESRVTGAAVKQAVQKAGYGIAEKDPARRVTIPIEGMTCASCSARVEKVVGRLAGVRGVAVNLATERAEVLYEPEAVRLSAIKKAIADAGYTPREVDAGETVDRDAQRKEREIRGLRAALRRRRRGRRPPAVPGDGAHAARGAAAPARPARPDAVPPGVRPGADPADRPRGRGRLPLLPRRQQGDLAPGAEHGLPDRHRHRGRHPLQPVLDLEDPRRGLRRGAGAVLRDRRGDHRPDPAGQDPGGGLQGQDLPGDQEADGAGPQDGDGHPRRAGDRDPHRRGGGRRPGAGAARRRRSRWTAR